MCGSEPTEALVPLANHQPPGRSAGLPRPGGGVRIAGLQNLPHSFEVAAAQFARVMLKRGLRAPARQREAEQVGPRCLRGPAPTGKRPRPTPATHRLDRPHQPFGYKPPFPCTLPGPASREHQRDS